MHIYAYTHVLYSVCILYVYVRICICIHVSICVCVCMYLFVCVCMCTMHVRIVVLYMCAFYMCVSMCVYMHAIYVCLLCHVYVGVCMYVLLCSVCVRYVCMYIGSVGRSNDHSHLCLSPATWHPPGVPAPGVAVTGCQFPKLRHLAKHSLLPSGGGVMWRGRGVVPAAAAQTQQQDRQTEGLPAKGGAIFPGLASWGVNFKRPIPNIWSDIDIDIDDFLPYPSPPQANPLSTWMPGAWMGTVGWGMEEC